MNEAVEQGGPRGAAAATREEGRLTASPRRDAGRDAGVSLGRAGGAEGAGTQDPRGAQAPAPRRVRAAGPRMRGFGRAYERANGTWAIAYYVHGQEVRESVAKLVGKPPRQVIQRDAERALRQRLAEVQSGTFVEPAATRATVDEI